MHEDLKEESVLEPVTILCPWGEWVIYQDLSSVKGGKKDPRSIISLISIPGKK